MKETAIELARRMKSCSATGGHPALSYLPWSLLVEALEARTEQQPVGVAGFDAAAAIRSCMEEFPESVQDIVEECAQIAENTISSRHVQPAPAPVTVKLPDSGLTEFERGVFYAAYLICELHDDPTIAADVIKEANLDGFDIGSLDDCERESLLKLNASERLSLTVAGIKIAEGE